MLWTLDDYRARCAKQGECAICLCPLWQAAVLGSQLEGTTLWLTAFPALGSQSYRGGAGACSKHGSLECLFISLFLPMLGRSSPVPFGHSETQRTGEGWTRIQGHRQRGIWLCT